MGYGHEHTILVVHLGLRNKNYGIYLAQLQLGTSVARSSYYSVRLDVLRKIVSCVHDPIIYL